MWKILFSLPPWWYCRQMSLYFLSFSQTLWFVAVLLKVILQAKEGGEGRGLQLVMWPEGAARKDLSSWDVGCWQYQYNYNNNKIIAWKYFFQFFLNVSWYDTIWVGCSWKKLMNSQIDYIAFLFWRCTNSWPTYIVMRTRIFTCWMLLSVLIWKQIQAQF